MHVIEIAGANFHVVEPESRDLLSSIVSRDGSKLACVHLVPSGFRIRLFIRGNGAPQWQGKWWHEQQPISLTDTRQQTDNLAEEHVDVAA